MLFKPIHYGVVLLSLPTILLLLPWMWNARQSRLMGLGFVIVSAVILNALFTGTLSGVNDRYEARVIWLVPFLAGSCILSWRERRGNARHAEQSSPA